MDPEFAVLIIFCVVVLIIGVVLMLIPVPIEVVYNNDGEKAFSIYQNKTGSFIVKGHNGYTQRAFFRRYVDVVAYCDKKINGWSKFDEDKNL